MNRLLVVTASRAFETAPPSARAWALCVIHEGLLWIEGPHGWLMAGGAVGPDTWAVDAAARRSINRVEYLTDGTRRINGAASARARWDVVLAGPTGGDPLARNRAMSYAAQDAMANGWIVACVAIVAPWSTTRGTQHTARCMRDRGIWTETYTCPMEYAP